MPNWKLEIEYEGTRYRGWQVQNNVKTIQGELNKAAYQLFSGKVKIVGAGRTDAGVHAIEQIAHLNVSKLKKDIRPKQIQYGFNDLLPHDINILKVKNASEDFHALHDAVGRQYLYQISKRRAAFAKNFVWWVKDELNMEAMADAARMFIGKHDFSSFAQKDETKNQSTKVTVENAEIFLDADMICFRIKANYFLWKMVRRIVGMIVEVGRGNLSDIAVKRMLKYPTNAPAKFTAPPSGLFLEKVFYKK